MYSNKVSFCRIQILSAMVDAMPTGMRGLKHGYPPNTIMHAL